MIDRPQRPRLSVSAANHRYARGAVRIKPASAGSISLAAKQAFALALLLLALGLSARKSSPSRVPIAPSSAAPVPSASATGQI